MKTVGIIDYGAGNFSSVWRAMERIQCTLKHVQSYRDLDGCDRLILPGVGAFNTAMVRLRELGLIDGIDRSVDSGIPFLGICVGMQILATRGTEFGDWNGLNLIPGSVDRFELNSLPLPHIGWNNVHFRPDSLLFSRIEQDSDFYFVHSYHFRNVDEAYVSGYCDYGYRFPAALERDHILGVQFHPEKSHSSGLKLLTNFVEMYA